MSATITEDMLPPMQRGLSDWWTEETEYVFQRIERWAAFARGYNRLRSQRYSRGRLTMTEDPAEPGWNISANKLVVEDCGSWNPRFHNLQRSRRRKSRPEETRINCCGTFNYQSNNHLDSPCLETYRYDHSIYFKTIGDIRKGDRDRKCNLRRPDIPNESSPETSDQEQVEPQAKTIGEIECHHCNADLETDVYEFLSNECKESIDFGKINVHHKGEDHRSKSTSSSQIWPIIDMTQLDIKTDESIEYSGDSAWCNGRHTIVQMNNFDAQEENFNNNNIINNDNDDSNKCNKNKHDNQNANRIPQRRQSPETIIDVITTDNNLMTQQTGRPLSAKKQEVNNKRLIGARRTRQSPRKVCQPTIVGENNVVWPGVLLNYKKNVDAVNSPFRHSIKE